MTQLDKERLARIVDRIAYGYPPETFDDLRYLAEIASGQPIPIRKRCSGCGGDGLVSTVQGACDVFTDCPACSGTGFMTGVPCP